MESDLLIKVLLSTVLGFLGGWLVKTVFANGRLRSAERDWELQLKNATEARDVAALTVRQLRSQVGEMESSFAAVEKDMTRIRDSMQERERSIHGLREEMLQAKSKIQETDRLRAALADRDEKLKKLASVRAELLKRTAQSSELEAARLEVATMAQRATQLESENAGLNDICQQLKVQIEQLNAQQAALIEAASEAQSGQPPQPSQAEHDSQAAKIGQLESQLKTRDQALARLQQDFSDFKVVAEQSPHTTTSDKELSRRLEARDQTIKKLYEELESSRLLLSKFQQRMNDMEQEHRRTSTGQSAQTPQHKQSTASQTPTDAGLKPSLQERPSSRQDIPLFYDKPPTLIDDLTNIKGIGPVLAKTLNAMGIYQFDQLANLSEDDVVTVTHKLRGFKDRIHRDDWINQARELTGNKR
ncbi:MAG: helix-hairpin-helix domain-containing protein [Lysobacterales bacterium]